jgi:hypothetical protein
MSHVSQHDVDQWIHVVGHMRYNAFCFDRTDEVLAGRSIADLDLLDECGCLASPPSVREMFTQLMEIGYLMALRDLRDGGCDGELAALAAGRVPSVGRHAGSGDDDVEAAADDEPGRDQAQRDDGGADPVVGGGCAATVRPAVPPYRTGQRDDRERDEQDDRQGGGRRHDRDGGQ